MEKQIESEYRLFKQEIYIQSTYNSNIRTSKLIRMLNKFQNSKFKAFFLAILTCNSEHKFDLIELSYVNQWINRFESYNPIESMDFYRKSIYEILLKLYGVD